MSTLWGYKSPSYTFFSILPSAVRTVCGESLTFCTTIGKIPLIFVGTLPLYRQHKSKFRLYHFDLALSWVGVGTWNLYSWLTVFLAGVYYLLIFDEEQNHKWIDQETECTQACKICGTEYEHLNQRIVFYLIWIQVELKFSQKMHLYYFRKFYNFSIPMTVGLE